MVGTSWASSRQETFLKERLPQYREIFRTHKNYNDFWASLRHEWQKDKNWSDARRLFPDTPRENLNDDQRTTLQSAIRATEDQLQTWFRWRVNPSTGIGGRRGTAAKLEGTPKTRFLSYQEMYSKEHYHSRIKPTVTARLALMGTISRATRMKTIKQITAECWENETSEIKAIIISKCAAQAPPIQDDDENATRTPEQYLQAIKALPTTLANYLRILSVRTGYAFSVVMGGPHPESATGAIQVSSLHLGQTSLGTDFGHAMPDFNSVFMPAYTQFLENIYPSDIRASRVLGATSTKLDGESDPSTQMDDSSDSAKNVSTQVDDNSGPANISTKMDDESGPMDAMDETAGTTFTSTAPQSTTSTPTISGVAVIPSNASFSSTSPSIPPASTAGLTSDSLTNPAAGNSTPSLPQAVSQSTPSTPSTSGLTFDSGLVGSLLPPASADMVVDNACGGAASSQNSTPISLGSEPSTSFTGTSDEMAVETSKWPMTASQVGSDASIDQGLLNMTSHLAQRLQIANENERDLVARNQDILMDVDNTITNVFQSRRGLLDQIPPYLPSDFSMFEPEQHPQLYVAGDRRGKTLNHNPYQFANNFTFSNSEEQVYQQRIMADARALGLDPFSSPSFGLSDIHAPRDSQDYSSLFLSPSFPTTSASGENGVDLTFSQTTTSQNSACSSANLFPGLSVPAPPALSAFSPVTASSSPDTLVALLPAVPTGSASASPNSSSLTDPQISTGLPVECNTGPSDASPPLSSPATDTLGAPLPTTTSRDPPRGLNQLQALTGNVVVPASDVAGPSAAASDIDGAPPQGSRDLNDPPPPPTVAVTIGAPSTTCSGTTQPGKGARKALAPVSLNGEGTRRSGRAIVPTAKVQAALVSEGGDAADVSGIAPTSTPTIMREPEPPQWFDDARTFFLSHDFGTAWRSCITSWERLEAYLGYGNVAGTKSALPNTNIRPEEWSKWTKTHHRSYLHLPSIPCSADLGMAVVGWWYAMQPSARKSDEPGVLLPNYALSPLEWEPLCRAGVNGVASIMTVTMWWAVGLTTRMQWQDDTSARWAAHIADVSAVFNAMVEVKAGKPRKVGGGKGKENARPTALAMTA